MKMNFDNPANTREQQSDARSRIPMSLPQLKLSVPEIPGYHLHWMRGDAARITQARRAGYEFVDADEVHVANTGLADDADTNGNTDMGTRVSIVAGSDLLDGQPERLYLMKIRQEWWDEDQKAIGDKNEQVAATLRGEQGENGYIPRSHEKQVANLFQRKN